jgi:hypothetical protein
VSAEKERKAREDFFMKVKRFKRVSAKKQLQKAQKREPKRKAIGRV